MKTSARLLAPLVAIAAVLAVAGCSRSSTTTTTTTTITDATSASASVTATSATASTTTADAASSSATISSATTSSATTSSATTSSATAGAQAGGSAGGVDVTVTAGNSSPLRPGGEPLGFTVTLANNSAADIADVGLVVAMGHCSCVPSGARMMPPGSMTMLDPDTTSWVSVPYVREGTGTDFLSQTVVPPFVLKQGATNTYQFEVKLDPNPEVTAGDASVNVALTTASGSGTAATIPVTVQP